MDKARSLEKALGKTSRPAIPMGPDAEQAPPAPAISRRVLLCGGACSALAPLLSGCTRPGTDTSTAAKPVTGSTFAFDTYCTFSVYGDDAAPARLAEACAHFDALFDLYDEKSDIARINAAAGEAVRAHADTVDLLLQARSHCEQAEGLFDVTIGAVSTLWDFTEGVRPTPEAIAGALPHVDWRCIEIDEEALTVRLADPQAKLDLGGIAKGYVADRLCDLLRAETRATGAVLSLGGNIALFGEKPNGEPWETGVRDPNDPSGDTVVGTARVQGGSLVTSGLYERVFEQDGVTYWHILDPRTGEPVQTDVASVTVLSPSSTAADALSTTLFVAGSRRGAEIADALEDTAAYFILQDGRTVESTRWQELTNFSSQLGR